MLVRLLVISLLLAATACSSSTQSDGARADGRPVSDVSALYVRKCAGCHGTSGSDQAATSLTSVAQLSRVEIDAKVRLGGEQMPAFGEALSVAEREAIVDYVIDNF